MIFFDVAGLICLVVCLFSYYAPFAKRNRYYILHLFVTPFGVMNSITLFLSCATHLCSTTTDTLFVDFICTILDIILLTGLIFIMLDCAYIPEIFKAYNEQKNNSDPRNHLYLSYQKINIKLFNKCFQINPEQFEFIFRHESVIAYKYANKSGYCGISCGFFCYLWMHDCILHYQYSKEQEKITHYYSECPISADVTTTIKKRLEEINDEINNATKSSIEIAKHLK